MEEIIEKIKELFDDMLISYEEKEMPVLIIKKDGVLNFVKFLKDNDFKILLDITAVDYLKWPEKKEDRFEIVYHFFSLDYNQRIRVKFPLKEGESSPSLTPFYKNANWLEREVYDMYGIKFKGHPDLRRILMYDEFKGYPLRKDYPLKKRQPRLEGLKDD